MVSRTSWGLRGYMMSRAQAVMEGAGCLKLAVAVSSGCVIVDVASKAWHGRSSAGKVHDRSSLSKSLPLSSVQF